jgi:hypothetical protein
MDYQSGQRDGGEGGFNQWPKPSTGNSSYAAHRNEYLQLTFQVYGPSKSRRSYAQLVNW